MKITYIGHSTVLLEWDGGAFLTDPNFSDKVIIAKRKTALGYDPAHLPKITAVLLSHLHLDHFDTASFNFFKTTVPIITAEGSGRSVIRRLPNPVIELSHWAVHRFGDTSKITAVPARHSGYTLYPLPFRRANGYIIEGGGKTAYFAGDTAYGQHFKDIGNTYSIDIALLPISCYKPAFFMKRYHMDPAEAVQAAIDLKAKIMVPIHWGTFRLSFEKLDEPVEWLKKAAAGRGIEECIKILSSGESIEV